MSLREFETTIRLCNCDLCVSPDHRKQHKILIAPEEIVFILERADTGTNIQLRNGQHFDVSESYEEVKYKLQID